MIWQMFEARHIIETYFYVISLGLGPGGGAVGSSRQWMESVLSLLHGCRELTN